MSGKNFKDSRSEFAKKNQNKKSGRCIEEMIRNSPFKFAGDFETTSSLSGFDFWTGKKKVE